MNYDQVKFRVRHEMVMVQVIDHMLIKHLKKGEK